MKSEYQILIIHKLKKLREQKGVSQGKLACYLGISNGQMGNIESPKMSTKYTLSQIYSLCELFNIRIDHLFMEDEDYNSDKDIINLLITKIIRYEGR
jgi:transcriptional regulator with XRE-family HTH domain